MLDLERQVLPLALLQSLCYTRSAQYLSLMSTVLTDSGFYMAKRSRRDRQLPNDPLNSVMRSLVQTLPVHVNPLAGLRGLDDARRYIAALQDRRQFHPMGVIRPAGGLTRRATRQVISSGGNKRAKLHSAVSFNVPRQVSVCVKRKMRKEIMHAFGHAGKGGAKRPYRRNYWSDVRC